MGANALGGVDGPRETAVCHPQERILNIVENPAASTDEVGGVSEVALDAALDRNDWLGALFGQAFGLAASAPPVFAD